MHVAGTRLSLSFLAGLVSSFILQSLINLFCIRCGREGCLPGIDQIPQPLHFAWLSVLEIALFETIGRKTKQFGPLSRPIGRPVNTGQAVTVIAPPKRQ